ncbi:MAG: hypothetical protein WBX25_06510 [Rhodomicrobium sp.]
MRRQSTAGGDSEAFVVAGKVRRQSVTPDEPLNPNFRRWCRRPASAYRLNRQGFTATLVERAPSARRGGYVIDFRGLGYDLVERMGLASEIERLDYHIDELRIVDDRGKRVAGFGTGVLSKLTGGRYVTLARSDLSRLILERVGVLRRLG